MSGGWSWGIFGSEWEIARGRGRGRCCSIRTRRRRIRGCGGGRCFRAIRETGGRGLHADELLAVDGDAGEVDACGMVRGAGSGHGGKDGDYGGGDAAGGVEGAVGEGLAGAGEAEYGDGAEGWGNDCRGGGEGIGRVRADGRGSAGILPALIGFQPVVLHLLREEVARCWTTPRRQTLAGRMPARTGKMPALPQNALQQSPILGFNLSPFPAPRRA